MSEATRPKSAPNSPDTAARPALVGTWLSLHAVNATRA